MNAELCFPTDPLGHSWDVGGLAGPLGGPPVGSTRLPEDHQWAQAATNLGAALSGGPRCGADSVRGS